jgi:glutamate carboxypeptidase
MTPSELETRFHERLDAMIGEIREIVDIESPSFDADASSRVAEWLEEKAKAITPEFTVERHATEGVGEHVIIRAFAGDEKANLILGHTDTVHAIGTHEKNPTHIEDDKFYGCGIFDMKANIVLMFEALRYFVESGERPLRPVNILLTADEEVGSKTGRPLVESEAAKAENCFVFEPSAAGKVKTGRKGTGTFTVSAHGSPSHAGLDPEKGANAVTELARQVEMIHAIARKDSGTTVNVTTFHGGAVTNVIPDLATCEIDVRFSSIAEGERVMDELKRLSPFDERVRLEFTGDINRPPLERTDAVAALFEKARGIAAEFDYALEETQVGGASDGNFVAALGVPVLDGLGIAGDGAHTLHEHILVNDIAHRAMLVTMLLSRI